jgi:hypothetical protein
VLVYFPNMEISPLETEEQISEKKVAPDLTELGALCGCTDKQIKFAEGLLAGMNLTEAAFHAGYSGARDSVQLRSAGSSAARAKPVQALLALAESRGMGIPDAPGDKDELVRILWSHARSKDKAHSIKASAELNRIMDAERAAKDAELLEPEDALAAIAAIMPAVAVMLAKQDNIKFELNEEQRAEYDKFRRSIALEYLEECKQKDGATL